ncbi:thioredoxin domain-containing protein 16 [Elysia marginata]|uniref:Thioredoxin domain-containing protein 16 n=1 Tax=Elysia marginata TaxID=1093978 RepID=A0AAV4IKX7_9GAST|nr:thioredoxin domain-containing protein 16 [Elysia marginata]
MSGVQLQCVGCSDSHLQSLLLLHEVPIVQSRLELQELELSLAGRRDLLIIHPQAVGTPEHRIFLEVAHAYQDRISFALTMDLRTLVGLQDSEAIAADSTYGLWVMFCSQVNKDDIMEDGYCPHTMYRGRPTLYDIAEFVKKLGEKSVFHAPEDGTNSLFGLTSVDPIVYVYINSEEEQENTEIVNVLRYDLQGAAKVIFVNMEDAECQSIARQQGFKGEGPGIGVETLDEGMKFSDPKEWTVSGLRKFLLPYVFPDWGSGKSSTSSLATPDSIKKSIDSLIDQVETQDDQVASAVYRLRQKEMAGLELVPELLKDNFYKNVRRSALLIVLFYEPFDHVSMAFLRDFGLAAQILAKNFSTVDILARVNCFDATDLCSAENVTTYPTTRIYQQNTRSHEVYRGPLDALAVTKTAKLMQLNSPKQLTREEEVNKFIEGHHPTDFTKLTPSSVLFLARDSTSDLTAVFKEVSRSMAQVTALAVVHSSIVHKIEEKYEAPVPSLVAYNREDKVKPVRILDLTQGDKTAGSMTSFIRASTIAFVPELDEKNFPHLYARHQPMTILFVDGSDVKTKEAALASFTSLAMSNQFSATVLCWMDAQVKSLGLQILSEYTWTAQIPMVSVVKHRHGQVFNFKPDPLNDEQKDPIQSDKLSSWLLKVLSGKAIPSKILEQGKWGPPGPYYNFLEFQQTNTFNKPPGIHKDGAAPMTETTNTSFDDGGSTASFDEGEEEEEDLMESEARSMLLELHNQHKSPQEPKLQATAGDGMSVTDAPPQHGHTEL